MKNKFIQLPVYEHLYKKSSPITDQLINLDYIIRVYPSQNHEYEEDTFVELTSDLKRVALPYEELVSLLNT